MLFITDNIKYLRNKRKLSQQEAADGMNLPLDRYKKYEYKNIPPAESLIIISRFYGVSIDLLLTVDLSKIEIDSLFKLENNRILMPIAVDKTGDNLVEVVTHKAKAGYAAGGYADFKFISELDHIVLPWLGKNEKYRTFPIDGDSMPPHNNDSSIVGKYVEKIGDVVDGRTYIIITYDKEMVYKRLNKNGKNALMLSSDNRFYKPYEVKFSEIAEIWEYAGSIEKGIFKPDDSIPKSVEEMFLELRNEMREVYSKIA